MTNVYYPPDTQACIFWLRNRRRRTWRDGPNADADDGIDDIARLEAAGESVRHHDGARVRRVGSPWRASLARLEQTGPLSLRSAGLRRVRLSLGAAGHGARRRDGPGAVAVRGAGEARPRPEGAGHAPAEAVRLAVASGHGIGKSALVSWIILWALSTLPDTRGVVTANTEGQLRTKTWPELAKWHALRQQGLVHLHRDSLHSVEARPRPHLARRRHHLVGEQHRGHRRPAQQGPARLRAVRRGLGDRRRRVGDHRGRADRCRHRALLARLRQSHAHHRPLPRMLRRRPLRPSLGPAADRFALGVDDQQDADRHLGARLRRGFRLRARARQGRVPARRHHAVHRQRARRAGGGARAAVRGSDIGRSSWASTSRARATTRPSSASAAGSMPAPSRR